MTPTPVPTVITGLPGTGKTTLAQALAAHLSIAHFNTDKLRMEMGLCGRYDEATKAQVYDELYKMVQRTLAANESVIVDATMYKKAARDRFRTLAAKADVPIVWIETRAAEPIIKQRVSKSRPYSEADYGVYQKIKGVYEPLEGAFLPLHTDQVTLRDMVKRATDYITIFYNQSTHAS